MSQRLLLFLLWLTRRKQRYLKPAALSEAVARDRLKVDGAPPEAFRKRFAVDVSMVQGHRCYGLSPHELHEDAPVVLYLHGGAYCMEMTPQHWDFVAELVERTGCRLVVPLYPLAPERTHRDAFDMMREVHDLYCEEVPQERFVLMGDSAGGGFALSFAQQLAARRKTQPRDIVLIAPWLDLTLRHARRSAPRIDDPWLALPGLAEAARWWSGGDPTDSPTLNPLGMSLRGLGHLTVFIGSRDILIDECRALRDNAALEGVRLDWIEGNDLIHAWPVLPIREARPARLAIAGIIGRRASLATSQGMRPNGEGRGFLRR